MSLKSKVDSIYFELEFFEKKVRDSKVYNPKYQADINRLKFHCHQLHSDAVAVDQLTQVSRVRPDLRISEVEKGIYLLFHEFKYLKKSFNSFIRFERNPPSRSSGVFSSPSESGSPEPEPPRKRSPLKSSGLQYSSSSSSSGLSGYSSSQSLSQSSSYSSSQESSSSPVPQRFSNYSSVSSYSPAPIAANSYHFPLPTFQQHNQSYQQPRNFVRTNYYY